MAWRNGSSSRQGGVLSPVPGGRHTSESSLNARSPLRTIEITCSGRFLAALPSRGSLQPFFPEYGPVSHQPSRPPTLPSTSALYLIAPSVGTTMSPQLSKPKDLLSKVRAAEAREKALDNELWQLRQDYFDLKYQVDDDELAKSERERSYQGLEWEVSPTTREDRLDRDRWPA